MNCGKAPQPILADKALVENPVFKASPQPQEKPRIVIENGSKIALRLLLNDDQGKLTSLDVPGGEEKSLEVSTVRYDAKIIDPSGKTKGLSGVVWPKQFHQYRASFTTGSGTNEPPFFIGDK